jgi:hypothetical protein
MTHKYTDKIKYHTLQVKCLLKILCTQICHKTNLCRKLQFSHPCFEYEWRLFMLQHFKYISSLQFKANDKQERTTLRNV